MKPGISRFSRLAALGEPLRTEPVSQIVNVTDAVVRRDNVVSIVEQTRLLESWRRTRTPIG